MRILYISYNFPYPPNGGSIVRDYNLIRQLSRDHELHWINRTITGNIKKEYLDEMKQYFKEMKVVPWNYKHSIKGLLNSLFTKNPYIINRFKSNEMKKLVNDTIENNNFDLVLCDHIYLAQYIPDKFISKIPIIPNNEDCGFTFYKRMSENSGIIRRLYAKTQWKKILRYEIEILKKFKVYITTSEKEKELMSGYYSGAEICVIDNGVDTRYFSGRERKDFNPQIVFTAWYKYYPNVEAVVNFAEKIFPVIKKEIRNLKFYVVGKDAPKAVTALAKIEGVIVAGCVDDVRDYLQNSDAAVIPLKVGGGTRLKILEALAMKIPVVSTAIGAEGLQIKEGENILIAKDEKDFAEKIINIINNKSLSKKLASNGRALVVQEYDWDNIAIKLNKFLNDYVSNFNRKNGH